MKHRMVWKLAVSFFVVLLLFTVVLSAVFLTLFRQHTIAIHRAVMEEKATSIADALSAYQSREAGFSHHDNQGLGAFLHNLETLAMADVWIVDRDMNLLTHERGHQATDEALPAHAEQIVRRVFGGEMTYGEDFSGVLKAPTLTVGAPIRTSDGIVFGVVLLHSPVSGIDNAVRQCLSALGIGAGVALVLAGCAALLLAYRFTKPLRRMKAAALQLVNGEYGARTTVTQCDEIGQVARTIDLLAERLALAERERVALDQMKQNFIANVSHELRTPVAVLRGSLEVLRDGTVSEPTEVADYYTQMLAESRHLERLVNDLLDLSRLQDAQFPLDMEAINLCDVLRDSVRAIRRPAQEKKISVSMVCSDEACVVQGDYGRVRQMLLILLDNAVKFSETGMPVEAVLKSTSSGFSIDVIDHGLIVPPDELPHIFERFHKTNNAENKEGSGLGLAIAKQIADRHNARILVESTANQTCFTVLFLV